jgi:predicted negative regulator of RcsB-dependent stress response
MAIDELLDEHEQSERVREWLRRNGSALIFGIALGLAAIGGWQWWQRHQTNKQHEAAASYQAAVDAIKANDKAAAGKANGLPDGMFRTLAQLELAKSQVQANQNEAAIATLRSIRSEDPALAAIVNQRLARLLIDSRQADAALKLVANGDSLAMLEVRGDAQMALGQREQARQLQQSAAQGRSRYAATPRA